MPKTTFFNLPEEKRERIIQTAMEEFSKAPYQDISINHLIKCMNIPTGSFYQYFEDKKDLYFYILSFYMDDTLEESIQSGKKLDLFHNQQKQQIVTIFNETHSQTKNYQAICVDNFNQAPQKIKRDWIFENMIGGKYMALYDYGIFERDEVDPAVKDAKYLMMALAMAVPNILQCFCDRNEDTDKYRQLYRLCMNVIQTGILKFRTDELELL